MRDETMSGASGESLLACATADVMIYEESTKLWVRPDDAAGPANSGIPTGQKLSNVQLIQDNNAKSVGFRIVAIRIHDRKVLINQNIYAKLKYHAATNSFHQWRNEHRQVFGLSFTMEQEATKFFGVVQQVMEWHGNAQTNAIQAANDDYGTHQHTQHHQQHYANGNGEVNNGVNNSVYQDPQYYQFQQQQPQMSSGNQFHQHNHYAETDQSAMASSNGHTPASHAYRKSSYSTNAVHNMNTSAALANHNGGHHLSQHQIGLQNANIQRRASQASSNSSNSSGPIPSQNIYASATLNSNGHAINQQQPQNTAPSQSSAPPAPPLPSTGMIPPISSSAPPPPPPPPGSLKGLGSASKPASLADQLKQTQLRKVSNNNANAATNNQRTSSSSADTGISSGGSSTVSSKTSTISSTNGLGHSDFLSELASTINRRKNAGNGADAKEVNSTNSVANGIETSNGGNAFKPWQKAVNAVSNNPSTSTNTTTDSPRVHRKVPSGSSLSSQEEATSKPMSASSSTVPNGNNVGGLSLSQQPVTLADFERFKCEWLAELAKAKQEILTTIRQEFQQLALSQNK